MKDPDSLNVWSADRLVARLWRDPSSPQGMGLRYSEDWLRNGGFPISQQLPLTTEAFPASRGTVQGFFANLLPEGGARMRIVLDLKIPDTDFDLLRAIGGDCAGALSILPLDESPGAERQYIPLDDEKLRKLVMRRGASYVGISPGGRPRLSLAGAQDKCPVLVCDEKFFLPMHEAPSSHILKFEIPDYRNIPAYETFTTLLARRAGLPSVDIRLNRLGRRTYICIERFDRYRDSAQTLQRLHQEDFCQALGIGYQYKYEESGGPTLARCCQLVRDASTEPAIDLRNLLRWQIFNVLAGNSDGHAKNLSLLYAQQNHARLAPFYDLVCTRAIARIDRRLAFSVGGERDPEIIRLHHWEHEAENCGVRPRYLRELVQELARSLLGGLAAARAEFEQACGALPALQRVEQVVTRQCVRVLDDERGRARP